jgi:hypothetical protein
VLELICCAPVRINEVLDTRADCRRTDRTVRKATGEEVEYLGYAYDGSKKAPDAVKWIPTAMVPIADWALDDARRITAIEGDRVTVDFDGKEHDLSGMALGDLTLAYAITVHESQGSRFRRVVIPVQPSRLLDRSLVYTAIRRATDLAVIVGDARIVREALGRSTHAERRETALGPLLNSNGDTRGSDATKG